MEYVIAGLAVYKVIQILDVLTPKEAMPWVKILVGTVLGYGASFLVDTDHRIIDGREAVLGLVAMKEALEDPSRLLLDL